MAVIKGFPAVNITVENVSVGYTTKTVVKNVSISARAGELTALVGPNGCGKSTLLRAIARVLPLQSGAVCVNDLNVHHANSKDIAKQLGLLPQGPVAPEGLTVKELVTQGRFPHQTLLRQWSPDDATAVEKAMHVTNVTAFAERQISDLSGGQRQRCWIAMILAQETPALLLDEPTTFLDLKVQVELMSLLSRVARGENRTVLVVLHDLNIAAAFADRIIMMRDGEIQADGTAAEVFNAENLKSVFDLDADILQDPRSGRPVCIPTPLTDFLAAE